MRINIFNKLIYLLCAVTLVVGSFEAIALSKKINKEDRQKYLHQLSDSDLIVYRPAKEVKAVVTVFTDPECYYCKKFHHEIAKLNDAGIEVRYAAFPRQGVGSDIYTKTVAVWCAKDRNEAMHTSMEGRRVPQGTCQHTIDTQVKVGRAMGLSGTPTVVFEDGEVFEGYLSAQRLASKALLHSSK